MGWRVGNKLGRTLYNEHGDLVGLMDTPARVERVLDLFEGRAQYLGRTQGGEPRHPLMLAYETTLMPAGWP